MVTEGLNNIAVALGKKVRDSLETEVIELDVAVAQGQHEVDELSSRAESKQQETNKLWQERRDKTRVLLELESDLRELSRPRDGFPHLNDIGYEDRMHELRRTIQEASEEMDKRAAWTE